jgi:transposase InsO family protein
LNRQGTAIARCTVERLMKGLGLQGIRREKGRRTTIGEGAETERPADLVQRKFVATAPNQLWVADLTYVRTHAGWAYAAFILDVFSRMVIGWQVSTSLRTDLALDALDMGLWARQRAGQDVAGLTHHSDRGAQYRAVRYTERLAEAEAVASVGSKGDSYDCEDRGVVVGAGLTRVATGPVGVLALNCRPAPAAALRPLAGRAVT